MAYYSSCGIYIQSFSDLRTRIAAIDAIIQVLEDQALLGASGPGVNLNEYKLNDGQTIIQETYTSPSSIAKAINDFETIKQRYVSRLNGRVFRAVDSKNFRNG